MFFNMPVDKIIMLNFELLIETVMYLIINYKIEFSHENNESIS
jgi:hypothetical protein